MKKIYKNVECVKLKSSWLFKRRTTLETFLNQKLNVKKNCDLKNMLCKSSCLMLKNRAKFLYQENFFVKNFFM